MGIDLNGTDHAMSANDNGQDLFAAVPELPLPRERWNARRKATVVDAVRGGWVPVEEVCRLYSLSADEILAWERVVDQYGVAGLHIKQLQVHRQIRRRP